MPASQSTMQLLVGSLLFLLGLKSYLHYRKTLHSVHRHPGFRVLFPPATLLGELLPRLPFVSVGYHWGMVLKHNVFAKTGWDVLSAVSPLPSSRPGYVIADPLAIKEIMLYRARFPKPIEDYVVLSYFGKNILITDGEEWKKHRKICGPSFSEKNFKFVWDETRRVMYEMFESFGSDNEVVIDDCGQLTLKMTLLVISAAAFGRRIAWAEDSYVPPGHELSFKDAIYTISTRVQMKVIAPKWLYHFSKVLRHLQLSEKELQMYMEEMIAERKTAGRQEERPDLFNALLDANEEDKEGGGLSDQELIGNIFIFLIAGHETTGHTLAFALGFLALEQEEQEKLYRHIVSVLPDDQIPMYEHIGLLTHSMAVLNETLRFFPPVVSIPKYSAEDTTLPLVQPDGSTGSIVVPKGAQLTILTSGLHSNPRYWPDPDKFNPSRFLGDWPRFAFLPFSAGARGCVGRRFAEVEIILVLTMVVRRFKIEVKNPELYEGLTHLQKRAKLLASRPGLTVTPIRVPLVFKRR